MKKGKKLTYSQKVITIASIFLAIVILFTFLIVGILINRENKKTATTNTNKQIIEYNGKQYIQDDSRINLLIIGVDDYGDAEEKESYINASFSDFLLLLSFDMTNKVCYSLQIDRDTMTNIPQYTRAGKYAGLSHEPLQITYSYNYGDKPSLSCLNTQTAVENLLLGIKINYYASVTMDAISTINDFVDGVTVKIEDDFSEVKSDWKIGDEVTLQGDEAEIFVRTRKSLKNNKTNENRMNRQKIYMEGLIDKLIKTNKSLSTLVSNLDSTITTNYNTAVADEIYNERANYKFEKILQIGGERTLNEEKNMMEFRVDENSLKEIVTTYFCVEYK